jgi:hypothetical protein
MRGAPACILVSTAKESPLANVLGKLNKSLRLNL